jgi:DNA-binding IscR family transcriptional regulator
MSVTSVALPHSAVSGFFLGNAFLHGQLLTVLRILERLKRNRKEGLTALQLAHSIGLPVNPVRSLMRQLAKEGLLIRQPRMVDVWVLTRAIDSMTLGDVYNCLARGAVAGAGKVAGYEQNSDNMAADLLLMQATMTINQSVAQQLRLFDLRRIGAADGGLVPAPGSHERHSDKLFA